MIKDSGPTRIPFRALITMCGETIENGELTVERGVIQSISTEGGCSGPGDLPDFSDCLILPGFVNAHSHLALSALEGMIPKREKFTDWAKELVPVNGNLNPMKRREVMLQAFPVLFRSGVTTLADYLADPELIEEFEKLPIRTLVFLEVLGFKNEFAEPLAHEAEKILAKYQSPHPLMKVGLAPHAPYTVSLSYFISSEALPIVIPVRFPATWRSSRKRSVSSKTVRVRCTTCIFSWGPSKKPGPRPEKLRSGTWKNWECWIP